MAFLDVIDSGERCSGWRAVELLQPVRRSRLNRGVREPSDGWALPDLDRALVSPASVFRDPDDVVRHPLLSLDCKREILRRWAWDEYLVELAASEGLPDGPPSRLEEVQSALIRVGDSWRPHPAAPAAFAVRLQIDERLLAA